MSLWQGLNANYAKKNKKIREIRFVRGIRVKDFPTLRKPCSLPGEKPL